MKKILYLIVLSGLLSACVKETHFGKSGLRNILYFSMSNQASNTEIIADSLIIRLRVSPQADLTRLFVDSVKLSSYAVLEPGVGVVQDFSGPVAYTVRAENGSTSVYTVYVTKESETPQLSNASLDDWYTPSGKNYQEPGTDDNTIWATGNAGVVTLTTANVQPITISGSDLAAELVTRDLGTLGQLVGQRMAAGTIFTGKFELDIANPIASAKFGIPFTARPKSVTCSYSYHPGTPYRNGKGQVLTKNDSCDIYVLIEDRSGPAIKRIATGWHRSEEQVDQPRDLTIELTYGPLPQGTPAYMFPANGVFGGASDPGTHFSFVAASSAYGAFFEGGANSTLVVNAIRLNY